MAYAGRGDGPKGPGELEYVFHEFHHSICLVATALPFYCGSGMVSRIPPMTSCVLKSFFGLLG